MITDIRTVKPGSYYMYQTDSMKEHNVQPIKVKCICKDYNGWDRDIAYFIKDGAPWSKQMDLIAYRRMMKADIIPDGTFPIWGHELKNNTSLEGSKEIILEPTQ